MMCPNCGSTVELKTERRPDGDTECGYCGHKGKSASFQKPMTNSREQQGFPPRVWVALHAPRNTGKGGPKQTLSYPTYSVEVLYSEEATEPYLSLSEHTALLLEKEKEIERLKALLGGNNGRKA